ncbi:MAG: 23S rRNA (adenine(2503)-C(2))-methyltransferase RlmN, partial [Bacteroidota bacterium]
MPETAAKIDIRTLSSEALGSYFSAQGQPAFRSRQVEEWLWKRAARSFAEMTNLPKGLRDQLTTDFTIHPLATATTQRSADGTIKSAFRLHDGHLIEGVLIPTSSRMTACISSQVGCSLSCKFCATGRLKRLRNLEAAEIFDQVVAIRQQAEAHYGQALSNIVYMGMGEPLLNYQNVLESVDRISSENGLGMSAKRITVSTAGIAKMIRRLGDDQVAFHLALSLHAANDRKRNTIMPINEQNA